MRLSPPRLSWLLIALLAYACSQQAPVTPTPVADRSGSPAAEASGAGAPVSPSGADPMTATVKFGHAGVGTTFPPTAEHDQSGHAIDSLVPVTVVIKAGGTVNFDTFGVHQLAIYAPGKRPEDVDVDNLTAAPAGCPPVPLINDPVDRIAFISRPCGPPVTLSYTFPDPGRHLVICTFRIHFVEFQMYGWVIVR
jgi:hypothetical protein